MLFVGVAVVCSMDVQGKNDSLPIDAPDWLKRLTDYKNLTVSFAYHAPSKSQEQAEVSSGTVIVSKNCYRLEMANQLVVCDGECVWTYLPQAQEVQLHNVDTEDVSPWMILQHWPEYYTIESLDRASVNGRDYQSVALLAKPESPQAPAKVELLFCETSASLVEMRLYETLEDPVHGFEIIEIEHDTLIDDAQFTFIPAAHSIVETIDMRQ